MFMWFSVTETYWWSARTSCWFVIYWCWHIFCGKYSRIWILVLIIYWCWHIFHVQNVLIILDWCLCDFLLLKHIDEVDALHVDLSLLMLTYFLCGKYSRISILVLIIYWCWLFFMCKMFLSFSTDVYVIFCYWNILMKCTHFMLICHLLMLTYFLWKYSRIWILVLIIYWCWHIFHVQNVLIILDWCLCDFLLLKHIDEVDALHVDLSFTDVDIFFVENILEFEYWFWLFTDVDIFFMCKMFLSFSTDVYVIICYWNISMKWMHFMLICHLLMLTYFLCGKYSRISILVLIIYWCWLFFMCKMFLSFSTDVFVIFCYWNISMKCAHFMLICHLLMLTFFYVQNVLIILNWCLCDFLVLKHIDEVHTLHLYLSLTDVDIFFVWKIFYDFNTGFDYLLMLTYFSCAKCSYHSRLMFMWFFCYWNISMKWMDFIFICHWHIFCVESILWFQYWFWLFTDVDIFFMCKMFLSFSTDVYVIFCYWNILMKCTALHVDLSFTDVDIFFVENILEFEYWFWLFTDVDIFFMCKMFLSFSTDVYVIFCYWNISMKWMHFMLICHLLMLTYFLCGKYSRISILVLIIYWCWLFFMCKMFLSFSTDVYVIFCYWNISMKCVHFMLICHLKMLTFFFMCKMFLSFSTDVYVIFLY